MAFSLCNNWQVEWNNHGIGLEYDLLITSMANVRRRAKNTFEAAQLFQTLCSKLAERHWSM